MMQGRTASSRRGKVAVALGLLLTPMSVLLLVRAGTAQQARVPGVCPPFFLLDESGQVIDPVHGTNASAPYSPKQTCGACHDYDTITEGFHFQQGRGEKPTAEQAERYQWVSSPGNYGGHW